MQYAYKIKIKKDPQVIKYEDKIKVPFLLSLDVLARYVGNDEIFYVDEVKIEDTYDTENILTVKRERMETQSEVKKRVAKEEQYMKGYYALHEKYK